MRCLCDYCVRGHLHNARKSRFNADDEIREFLNPVEEERVEREEEEFELEYSG